jgi:hypothetical protein
MNRKFASRLNITAMLAAILLATAGCNDTGPTGPAGPAGQAGPAGPAGPAGESSGLYVRDSNGAVLGQLVDTGHLLLLGTLFNSNIATGLSSYAGGPFYMTADCSGTPYLQVFNFEVSGEVIGTTAYVASSGTPQKMSAVAISTPTGSCASYAFTGYLLPVTGTIDLSSFVPPFWVH